MFSSIIPALSVRVLFAIVSSYLVAIIIGPRVIANLKVRQIGQTIREEGVQEHLKKAGIPTMGGIIILLPALITTFLWARWNLFVGIGFLATTGMAMIGMFDDLTKVIKARSLGLTPWQKLLGQALIGLAVGLVLVYGSDLRFELPPKHGVSVTVAKSSSTFTQLPFGGSIDLGIFYLPFVVLVMVGASNAVNLTDGLDGLAAGVTAVTLLPFLLFAYVSGNLIFARHLGVAFIPGSGELAIFAAAVFGGCLGFLWYNAHPAEVFMGDTGSLGLGGAVAAIAIVCKTELFLAIIGGIYVAEALSVMIQVSYFKWTKGKRIFRMSPIHHHFELSGWAEEKVVMRFFIVTVMLALTGLALFASALVIR